MCCDGRTWSLEFALLYFGFENQIHTKESGQAALTKMRTNVKTRSPSAPAASQTGFHVTTVHTPSVNNVETAILPTLRSHDHLRRPCSLWTTNATSFLGSDTQKPNHRPTILPRIPAPIQSHHNQSGQSDDGGIDVAIPCYALL